MFRSPIFFGLSVIALSLGIGANASVFSLLYTLMLKPLPVAEPHALYCFGDALAGGEMTGMQQSVTVYSYPEYQRLREQTGEFLSVAALQTRPFHVSVRSAAADDVPRSYRAEFVSGDYFKTFGVGVSLGRAIDEMDDRPSAAPVAVISHRAFESRFGRDGSVVGRTILVSGHPITVIGVAPVGFFGDTLRADPPDLWLPLSNEPRFSGASAKLNRADVYWLYLVGRLRPGVDPAGAEAHLTAEVRQWYSDQGETTRNRWPPISSVRVNLTSAESGIGSFRQGFVERLRLVAAVSCMVLLIACANISNLLLTRSMSRRAETSVKAALGASRFQLSEDIAVEALLLSTFAGFGGVLVATIGGRLMLALAFMGRGAAPVDVGPSGVVLLGIFLISLVAGVLLAAVPAYISSRTPPVGAVSTSSRMLGDGAGRAQRAFVAVQAGMSLVLLIGAALLTETLYNLQFQKFGFDSRDRYVARLDPSSLPQTPGQLRSLYGEIERSLDQIPGVASVSLSFISPQDGSEWVNAIRIRERSGAPDPKHSSEASTHDNVSAHYFETVGTRLVQGRLFGAHDTPDQPHVAVVNEAFVRSFLPMEAAIGKHVDRGELVFAGNYEIVGVVEDAKYSDPGQPAKPMMFTPLLQMADYGNDTDRGFQVQENIVRALQIHASGPTDGLEEAVRRAVAAVNPNVIVLSVTSLDTQIAQRLDSQRVLARIVTIYGVLALVLASVGIYGVAASMVTSRTREIGLRVALGASPARVVRLIVTGALGPVAVGLAVGCVGAVMGTRALAAQLYGLRAGDQVLAGSMVAVLALVSIVAAFIPAMRAVRIDPNRALKGE
jgi:predicted permease